MFRTRALTLAAALTLPLTVSAGTFTGWAVNGSASLIDSDNTVRLTNASFFEAGSAWAPTRVSLTSNFSVAFSFLIQGGSHADGLTFTVQNAAGGNTALGGSGGLLGYQGIEKSVAFVYDTFDNGFDTDRASANGIADNTSVAFGGDLGSPWGGNTIGTPTSFPNGLREQTLFSWVDYHAASGEFLMYLSDSNIKPLTATESFSSDILLLFDGSDALLGFTGGTGGSNDFHDVLSFAVTAVPLPGAVWCMAPGLLALLRKRRAA